MRDQPELLTANSHEIAAVSGWPDISLLGFWHLLSLDAPTVATLWTYFVARCCGLRLPAAELAAMFVAVWIIYAADRLLDARPSVRANAFILPSLELRHHFHDRHRSAFTVALTLALSALAILMLRMQTTELHYFTALAAAFAIWIAAVHGLSGRFSSTFFVPRHLPKEVTVGLFFSAAVFLPALIARPALRLPLVGMAVAFAALCSANCLYLYRWEHTVDTTDAHWTTRRLLPHLHKLAFGIVALAVACALAEGRTAYAAAWECLMGALALSALLLATLDRSRLRFSALHLRALADLALLTPVLFAIFVGKAIP